MQNSAPITGDYCRNTKERLIFHPESAEEAQFIADQLLRLGFSYYKPVYAEQLNTAAEGSLYLDTDKTIMVSGSRRTDGTLCTPEQFEQFFLAETQMGQGRIPPEEFTRRHMVFYPKTLTEARGVLAVLKSGGAEIEGDASEIPQMPVTRAAMQGIAVRGGVIRFAPTSEDLRTAEICSAADIGVFARGALSAEQATMVAVFNDMAARMEQMAQRIARLEEEVLPQDIPKAPAGGKPAVRRPR